MLNERVHHRAENSAYKAIKWGFLPAMEAKEIQEDSGFVAEVKLTPQCTQLIPGTSSPFISNQIITHFPLCTRQKQSWPCLPFTTKPSSHPSGRFKVLWFSFVNNTNFMSVFMVFLAKYNRFFFFGVWTTGKVVVLVERFSLSFWIVDNSLILRLPVN